MAEFIKVNGQEYPATCIYNYKDRNWDMRETQTVHLTMPYAQAAALLTTGTPWSNVFRETKDALDNDGNPTGQTEEVVTEEDMSAYSLAGAPATYARAVELRPIIEQAAVSLSDGEAATVPELITAWAYPMAYAEGDRRSYGGKVYKCRQAHTSQADWAPDKTPALWAVIDAEHAGTQADPIPASRGMEYEYGKYYLDSEDSKTYKCERIGEAAGGKIVLQYLPHELVGQYFTEV